MSRSVSSLSFHGRALVANPGANWWKSRDREGGASPIVAYDRQKKSAGNTPGILNNRTVKPCGGETGRSASSLGITTHLDSTAFGISSQAGNRYAPAIHTLWPGSKQRRRKHTSRSPHARPHDGEEVLASDAADQLEAASPDSQDSPLPSSPSWTEKPRIGYLFSIEDDGQLSGGRFGGAPQLTTKIANHRIPTPSRFQSASVRPCSDRESEQGREADAASMKENASKEQVSMNALRDSLQQHESLAVGDASKHTAAITASSTREGHRNVSSPITARRHKVSMHASVDLPQERQMWVAPESPDMSERPSSIHPLHFVSLRPTRKDNLRVFHLSYL